jgi:hypothetical protein
VVKPGPPAWQAESQAAQPSTTTSNLILYSKHERLPSFCSSPFGDFCPEWFIDNRSSKGISFYQSVQQARRPIGLTHSCAYFRFGPSPPTALTSPAVRSWPALPWTDRSFYLQGNPEKINICLCPPNSSIFFYMAPMYPMFHSRKCLGNSGSPCISIYCTNVHEPAHSSSSTLQMHVYSHECRFPSVLGRTGHPVELMVMIRPRSDLRSKQGAGLDRPWLIPQTAKGQLY